jgi:hypothetical protein
LNGDGFDDVIVGAFKADPNDALSGASYVVFGKAGGFDSEIDLAALDGTDGFRIAGEFYDQTGRAVSGAGDINVDGFDDVIIGAPDVDSIGNDNGASYVC